VSGAEKDGERIAGLEGEVRTLKENQAKQQSQIDSLRDFRNWTTGAAVTVAAVLGFLGEKIKHLFGI
jgi:hypothetical protein